MTASSIATTSSNPESNPEANRPPMRGWIILAGLAAFGLFVAAVAILCVQWLQNENPNASVTLQGELRLDDATVIVTPLSGSSRESLMAHFKDGRDHRVQFHLPPGDYNIVVRDSTGKLMFPEKPDREFLLDAMKPLFIRLQLAPPATYPVATQPQRSPNR